MECIESARKLSELLKDQSPITQIEHLERILSLINGGADTSKVNEELRSLLLEME